MTYLINERRARRFHRHTRLALLIAASLTALLPRQASAQGASAQGAAEMQIVIPVSAAELADPQALARIRRQIAAAAAALCDTGGLAAVYGNGSWRCRQRTIADAERQLQARLAPRLAANEER
jgi:UrcA family protein